MIDINNKGNRKCFNCKYWQREEKKIGICTLTGNVKTKDGSCNNLEWNESKLNSDPEYLWLYVTHDEYEFPIYICDSAKELAELLGIDQNNIHSTIRHSIDNGFKSRFRKVRFKEE